MGVAELERFSELVPHLLGTPHKKIFWVDYDEEAGVLYFSFKRSSHVDNTEDDVIIRCEKGEMVWGLQTSTPQKGPAPKGTGHDPILGIRAACPRADIY
ncbi:DUF2283 domain-containing protein [Methanotrichaceae archaeon M04Ac]|jgi:hypothetical protein|uniref:DUF2283 domain-containing protein n=1 Tax=Candidatus Methanocrinis alkalitolerans TaxID=3033395 RepID=A0ABT5XCD6_9EURY|nr:DUF2283 domain-containing protein [Candidatus Methanocrinis alkalitolerans]MDF0592374.1 DUF2283 domain-containing protein [Candidatus Methanocrinis alkalitolerans]